MARTSPTELMLQLSLFVNCPASPAFDVTARYWPLAKSSEGYAQSFTLAYCPGYRDNVS